MLLAYVVGMAALATLWPFEFRPFAGHWIAESTVEDVLLNLGLLAPAGFLWRIAQPGRRLVASLDALALGALLSALLESVQLFLPARCASPTDVFMNAVGAWAGACLHDALRRRYADAWLVRVCLTLPLTKLLYL
ncbi:MAG TPA: VanZ family protein, partial [Polyangiales bacterium]|nr:VanZ family protein [Polyangiales bacterium]